MRVALIPVLVLFGTVARAAEDPPKATWTVEGNTYEFAKEGMKDGVKVVFAFLGSCSTETAPRTGTGYTSDDLKKARAGEHFHLVFGKAQLVEVMGKPVEVTELVFSSGAIWVRSEKQIRRFAKYDFRKWQAFDTWLREAPRVK